MRKLLISAIAAISASVVAVPAQAVGYTETKYPILLVHGVAGFDTVGGLVNYFHTIPYNLERTGAKVYTTSVSFVNSSEARGSQLANFINTLPNTKYNIMAHSQGAPTSRVAASIVPHKIASITSIGGVNKGSKVADVVRGVIPPGSFVEGGANAIAIALGGFVNLLTGSSNSQNGVAALETLTTAGTTALNNALGWKGVNKTSCAGTAENVTYGTNTIKFFSWTGKRPFTNILDLTDGFMVTTSLAFGFSEDSDGLVGTCSTMMGTVISTNYEMNHADEINHLFGIRSIWLDPVSLYRSQANRLQGRGL